MHLPKQSMRPAILIAITTLATACTVQLVAPYNSELQQLKTSPARSSDN